MRTGEGGGRKPTLAWWPRAKEDVSRQSCAGSGPHGSGGQTPTGVVPRAQHPVAAEQGRERLGRIDLTMSHCVGTAVTSSPAPASHHRELRRDMAGPTAGPQRRPRPSDNPVTTGPQRHTRCANTQTLGWSRTYLPPEGQQLDGESLTPLALGAGAGDPFLSNALWSSSESAPWPSASSLVTQGDTPPRLLPSSVGTGRTEVTHGNFGADWEMQRFSEVSSVLHLLYLCLLHILLGGRPAAFLLTSNVQNSPPLPRGFCGRGIF